MAEDHRLSPRLGSTDMRARPITYRTVLTTGAVVLLVLVVLHGINGATVDGRFLSLDQEANLPSWIRVILYFVAASACAAAALLGDRRVWLGLAAVLLVFSLDDLAQGHEWLEGQTDAHTLINVVEPAAALVVAAVIALACRRLGPLRRGLILAGSALLVVGFAASMLNGGRSHGATVALSTVEQLCEAAFGWFLLAAAIEPALDAVRHWARADTGDPAHRGVPATAERPVALEV
jgi:hypothetical protein